MGDLRQPVAAGRFYESDPAALRSSIKACFGHEHGPKSDYVDEGDVRAALVPHAGYRFSGACAAHAYAALNASLSALNASPSEEGPLFIILGPNHSGVGSDVATSLKDWRTPLGVCKVNKEVAESLGIRVDESAHRHEHSIEVQLPFLQTLFNDFTFVPVCIRECNSQELASSIRENAGSAVIIASSDMTHYGLSYGYLPFRTNVADRMKEMDMETLELIKSVKPGEFSQRIRSESMTVCGWKAIETMLHWARMSDFRQGKLLKYYTSGDIIGDYSSAVGYASVVIKG